MMRIIEYTYGNGSEAKPVLQHPIKRRCHASWHFLLLPKQNASEVHAIQVYLSLVRRSFCFHVPFPALKKPAATSAAGELMLLKVYSAPSSASSLSFFSIRFIVGKRRTSRIAAESVKSIHIRSIPNPIPPVGGIPISSALRKSSSV